MSARHADQRSCYDYRAAHRPSSRNAIVMEGKPDAAGAAANTSVGASIGTHLPITRGYVCAAPCRADAFIAFLPGFSRKVMDVLRPVWPDDRIADSGMNRSLRSPSRLARAAWRAG